MVNTINNPIHKAHVKDASYNYEDEINNQINRKVQFD